MIRASFSILLLINAASACTDVPFVRSVQFFPRRQSTLVRAVLNNCSALSPQVRVHVDVGGWVGDAAPSGALFGSAYADFELTTLWNVSGGVNVSAYATNGTWSRDAQTFSGTLDPSYALLETMRWVYDAGMWRIATVPTWAFAPGTRVAFRCSTIQTLDMAALLSSTFSQPSSCSAQVYFDPTGNVRSDVFLLAPPQSPPPPPRPRLPPPRVGVTSAAHVTRASILYAMIGISLAKP